MLNVNPRVTETTFDRDGVTMMRVEVHYDGALVETYYCRETWNRIVVRVDDVEYANPLCRTLDALDEYWRHPKTVTAYVAGVNHSLDPSKKLPDPTAIGFRVVDVCPTEDWSDEPIIHQGNPDELPTA